MARDTPAHWKDIMDRRGIASIRELANKAGVSHPTALRVIHGSTKIPGEDTLAKIAAALDVPLGDVYWLVGRPAPIAEVWEPPAEANRLTRRQREALEDLIKAMTDPVEQQPGQGTVTELRPGQGHPEVDGLDVAADDSHGPSQGQLFRRRMDEAGEEPQE